MLIGATSEEVLRDETTVGAEGRTGTTDVVVIEEVTEEVIEVVIEEVIEEVNMRYFVQSSNFHFLSTLDVIGFNLTIPSRCWCLGP